MPGCVFPANLTSGVELSWVADERFGSEEDWRARTCVGAGVQSVVVRIEDRDDEDRSARFQFECEAGFQSPDEFVAQLSDLFLDLREGSYRLEVRALGPQAVPVYEESRDVKVREQRAKIVRITFTPDPIDLELDLAGLASCSTLNAALRYDDPAAQLADWSDDEPGAPLTYRAGLSSDRGLRLDDTEQACDDLATGLHRVEGIDPGDYVLRLQGLEGGTCEIPVALTPGAGPVRIELDLANPPC